MCNNVLQYIFEIIELFQASLQTRFSRRTKFIGFTFFIITFLLFIYLAPRYLTNGDAANYAQIITNEEFNRLTIHLGYYYLGYFFTSILPFSIDYMLNIMNCFFGALSVALIYFMGITVTKKDIVGIISSLLLATNYVFVFNSLYAEVYISQTFFLLLAIQTWLLNKPFFAGVTFALSFLITPSTVFAAPILVILRPNIKSILKFASITFLIIIIVLLPYINDYLFGNRGMFVVSEMRTFFKSGTYKEIQEIFWGFYVFIPFVIIGTIEVFKQKRYQIFGFAVFSIWLLSFFFGEKATDVPVQLPTYALLCIIGGIGVDSLICMSLVKYRGLFVWIPAVISFSILLIIMVIPVVIMILPTRDQILFEIILTFSFSILLITLVVNTFLKVLIDIKSRTYVMIGVMTLLVTINVNMMLKFIVKKNQHYAELRTTIIEMNIIADKEYLVVGNWGEGTLFEHYIFRSYLTGRWLNTEWLFGIGSWGKENQGWANEAWQCALEDKREIWLLKGADKFPSLFTDLRQEGYTIESFKSFYCAKP